MPDASTPTAVQHLPAATILRAPWKDIHRSPLNPRKQFDKDALKELAESIATLGLLQPLVVRPHPTKTGEYELLAGERRHRAVEILIETRRVQPDDQLPIQICKIDDTEASLVALAENMARSDLTPAEEAEAFAALKEKGLLPAEIGRRIGKTERFVQKRIRLKRDLDPTVFAFLVSGELGTEQANVIAMAPREKQATLAAAAIPADGVGASPDQLLQIVTQKLIPVCNQCFPLSAYTGEFHERDGKEETGGPSRWFGDTAQVQKLAKAVVDAKVEELKKKYPFCESKKSTNGLPFGWYEAKAGDKKAGAVVVFNPATAEMTVHAPVRKVEPKVDTVPTGAAPKGTDAKPAAPLEYADEFLDQVQGIAATAMRTAIAAKPDIGLRVLIFNNLGPMSDLELAMVDPAVGKRFQQLVAPLRAAKTTAAQWQALCKLDLKTLAELWVLYLMTDDNEFTPTIRRGAPGANAPGFEEADALVAEAAKVDIAKSWKFYANDADLFLDACGPAQLRRIATDLGIAHVPDDTRDTLFALVAKNVATKGRGYMPPWLAIVTPAGMAKRLNAKPLPTAKKKG